MNVSLKTFCRIFMLCVGLQHISAGQAQSQVRKTQQFTSVYYQFPVQYLRNGMKSMVELNMDEKYNIGLQLNSIYTYNPFFLNAPGNAGGGGSNVEITPNYYAENSIKFLFKNYIGNYSQSFHGYYAGLTAQTGLVRETYYSSLGQFFPKSFVFNSYRYNRFSFVMGRQWTLYNQGVVDLNMGVGFNKMDNDAEMEFTGIGPFHVAQNSAFFTMELAFGIGKISYQ